MIQRLLIPLIITLVLSVIYIDKHYLKRSRKCQIPKRIINLSLALGMIVFSIVLALQGSFEPQSRVAFELFLLFLGIYALPFVTFSFCSYAGLRICRLRGTKNNWGRLIGALLVIVELICVAYGSTKGVSKLIVNKVDIQFSDLPTSFQNYRIVHFSDAHVGSYIGWRQEILKQFVDSINSQKADLIVFTGDLQNIAPQELYSVMDILSTLRAKDGVYSVLGNHDYSYYQDGTVEQKKANEKEMIKLQKQMGWQLLLNESAVIHRGSDSLVIAGEENRSKDPYPNKGDLQKTLAHVGKGAFTILLQHDPDSWRKEVLPQSSVQLMLSGHTHGGQISVFGLRPTLFAYPEDKGLYQQDERYLYISSGIGGLVPFRLGVLPEIDVLTLQRK